jgi:hypothetical protein
MTAPGRDTHSWRAIPPGHACYQFRWSDEPDRWRDYEALAAVNPCARLEELQRTYATYVVPGSRKPETPEGVSIIWRIGTSQGHPLSARMLPQQEKT